MQMIKIKDLKDYSHDNKLKDYSHNNKLKTSGHPGDSVG